MDRSIQDANLRVTKALPAAGASNQTDPIDLGAAAPGISVENIDLVVDVPATASLADTKTHTLKVQDSADGSSFADVALLATQTRTGAGGAGAAASSYRWKLPPSIRRYIRISQTVEASGGNNTAVSITAGLRF